MSSESMYFTGSDEPERLRVSELCAVIDNSNL